MLILLVAQTTSVVLLMRHSKSRPLTPETTPPYIATAAVLAAEMAKLLMCIVMAGRTLGLRGLFDLLSTELLTSDMLKCSLPAVVFTAQSNLLFVALANLEAPTYQVAYQSKTIFTALLSWLFLNRQVKPSQ